MTLVSIDGELTAKAIADRNAMLEQKLRELGPGWAMGYRLKETPFPSSSVRGFGEGDVVTIEWELHAVQLVDGKIAAGLAGFQYVMLKE